MTMALGIVMTRVREHCAENTWRIVMTRVMEHSDDKLVVYFHDNGMAHCDGNGMGPCDEKGMEPFVTGF